MAAGIWHDRDADGNVIAEVEFDSAQCVADQQILRKFEALELNVSRNVPNTSEAVQSVVNQLGSVPKRRADHWKRELVRIGVIPQPAPEPKKDDKSSTTEVKK